MTQDDWIATEWQYRTQLDGMELVPVTVTITRMTSPFYEGVKYTVRCGSEVLTTAGKWKWEPRPSSRTAAFYERCRFGSFDEAVAAAEKAMGKMAKAGQQA